MLPAQKVSCFRKQCINTLNQSQFPISYNRNWLLNCVLSHNIAKLSQGPRVIGLFLSRQKHYSYLNHLIIPRYCTYIQKRHIESVRFVCVIEQKNVRRLLPYTKGGRVEEEESCQCISRWICLEYGIKAIVLELLVNR